MNEQKKKTNPLATVFYAISGVWLVLATIITYNSAAHQYGNIFRGMSFGEYLTSGGILPLLITSIAPAIILFLVGRYFSKKPPKEKKPSVIVEQKMPVSNADELKKYKELLEKEVITQEEFEAKKKQLLGL